MRPLNTRETLATSDKLMPTNVHEPKWGFVSTWMIHTDPKHRFSAQDCLNFAWMLDNPWQSDPPTATENPRTDAKRQPNGSSSSSTTFSKKSQLALVTQESTQFPLPHTAFITRGFRPAEQSCSLKDLLHSFKLYIKKHQDSVVTRNKKLNSDKGS